MYLIVECCNQNLVDQIFLKQNLFFYFQVICANRNLVEAPTSYPPNTRKIDLSGNPITHIQTDNLHNLKNLQILNLSGSSIKQVLVSSHIFLIFIIYKSSYRLMYLHFHQVFGIWTCQKIV